MHSRLALPLPRAFGAAPLQRLIDAFAARLLMRRRHAELQALDDRTLRDLGLHRSELLWLASDPDAVRSRRVHGRDLPVSAPWCAAAAGPGR